jgi:hypothetical protein
MLRPRMQRLLEEPAYRLKVGRGEGRAVKARPTGKVLGKAGDVMARWRRDWWKVEGKWPTASPKQPAFLKLRAMGTDAVRSVDRKRCEDGRDCEDYGVGNEGLRPHWWGPGA